MTVIVQTDHTLKLSKGQHRTTFRNPRGNKRYYSFYAVDGDLLGQPGKVVCEWSVDGIDWNNAGNLAITFSSEYDVSAGRVDAFDVKMRDDGSKLEIWVVGVGYNSFSDVYQLKYIYGTVIDAASGVSWSGQVSIDSNLNYEGLDKPFCAAFARTDNGRIVVAYTEQYNTMGKDYVLIKLKGSDGDGASPSWSGTTTWDDPSPNTINQDKGDIWFGLESFSSSYPNRCFLYAKIPHVETAYTYDVVTAVPDWNGTVFSNITQASWGEDGYHPTDLGDVLSGLIDESDIAHLVYKDFDAQSDWQGAHRKASTAGDDDLGSKTLFFSDVGNDLHLDALTIALDTGPTPDEIYVFYHDTVDSVDWHYKTSPVDSISFSAEKIISFHQDIIALSSWNRVVENSLHLAGLYGTTVIYNEHPVYKALSTTLADLEFPDQNYYLGPHNT